jgi:hypothetical protein
MSKENEITNTDSTAKPQRRMLLQASTMTLAGAIFSMKKASAAESALPLPENIVLQPPEYNPSSEYLFAITATISAPFEVGPSSQGIVRAIPITGGTVEGKGIIGRVVPGGADWQLSRTDGVTELEATYAIQMDDDTYIKVINRGIVYREEDKPAYFRTNVHFDAPSASQWNWMNEAIFLCKAQGHPTLENAVLIEVYRLI